MLASGMTGGMDEGYQRLDELIARLQALTATRHHQHEEPTVQFKLEVVVVPVSDVDRAKAFYADQLGFHVDVDDSPNEHFRVVQMTPRRLGLLGHDRQGHREMEPGSLKGLQLCVGDIEAAHALLAEPRRPDQPRSGTTMARGSSTARAASGTRSSSSTTRTATAGPSRRARPFAPRRPPAEAAAAAVACTRHPATPPARPGRARPGRPRLRVSGAAVRRRAGGPRCRARRRRTRRSTARPGRPSWSSVTDGVRSRSARSVPFTCRWWTTGNRRGIRRHVHQPVRHRRPPLSNACSISYTAHP